MYDIVNNDCLCFMSRMKSDYVDSIVTDPPYGLAFRGKAWDHQVPGVEYWKECFRVLKPGGHIAAFGGTRLYHRLTCAIEDAGFEIRDCLMWVYGSGFPKSHIALKPAWEPIILARKPFKGTVAGNVLEHGTGALNIDGCRVETDDYYSYPNGAGGASFSVGVGVDGSRTDATAMHENGRWPANLVHDGSDEVVELFPNNAQRFFYCAKASKAERGETNKHPTVKPVELMRWLCRLITPPKGLLMDPFMGSGTTLVAATKEGFSSIGIEMEAEYCKIALDRLKAIAPQQIGLL